MQGTIIIVPCIFFKRLGGGTGRRAGFKIPFRRLSESSILSRGTNKRALATAGLFYLCLGR